MLDFDTYEILSFDCYGTLIDWETGILSALAPVLARHGRSVPGETLLEAYGQLEAGAEQAPYRPYPVVLREVVEGLGGRFGFTPDEADRGVLESSLGDWPPFPDTRDALRAGRRSDASRLDPARRRGPRSQEPRGPGGRRVVSAGRQESSASRVW